MRNQVILLSLLTSLTASGCKALECAEGTVETNGRCEPATQKTEDALCGPFTMLVGDRCVPQFPPTVCEDGSTEPEIDPETGVTTCKGTGVVSCSSAVACPTPTSSSRMTICGQLYDFETNLPFAAPQASGARCDPTAPTADGPCALGIQAYDALAFGMNPMGTNPVPVTDMYIDDCGRYRLSEIDLNMVSSPYIGLGIDDIAAAGPTGVTVTAAVATGKVPMGATRGLEAWIVKPSTTTAWAQNGGPNVLTTGIYAPVFRAHKLGNGDPFANQEGVTFLGKNGPVPDNDFYFEAAATNRLTLDMGATATGANGTVLVNNATVADSLAYLGQGGLGDGCRWEPHAGASLQGIVFIQVFRKIDIPTQTCND